MDLFVGTSGYSYKEWKGDHASRAADAQARRDGQHRVVPVRRAERAGRSV